MARQKTNKPAKVDKDIATSYKALAGAIGVSIDTVDNYRSHPDAPKTKSIKAWKEFCGKHGLGFAFKTSKELKDKLTERDIILRDLEIAKRKGELVSRDEHDKDLMQLASIFRCGIESIPERLAAKVKSIDVQSEARRVVDELLVTVVDEIKRIK